MQQLDRLEEIPETAEELRRVARQLKVPSSEILLRNTATEEKFRARLLTDYDIIHFATHGLVWKDLPGLAESALVLSPGHADDPYDDGILSASEISRLSLNARLIVLSACNTAKYDVAQANTAIQDLQAAFTVAGAPTLLATLWPVESDAARDIIIGFYDTWKGERDLGAAPALASAVVAYLDRSDALRQHPWFWAPFIIAGNGEARGPSRTAATTAQTTFGFVDGFESGGEILHVVNAGADLIVSMFGEWDGKKMNGIISRRSYDGHEKWRVSSRQIGAGRVAVIGNVVFAAGYTTEEDGLPVLRSFDGNGSPRWQIPFPEMKGYVFDDLLATPDGLFIAAVPRLASGAHANQAVLLLVGLDGAVKKKTSVEVNKPNLNIGPAALLRSWGGQLALTFNEGASAKVRFNQSALGMPLPCFEPGYATIYAVDPSSLALRKIQSLPTFKITALLSVGNDLLVGGETQGGCSASGGATISRIVDGKPPHLLWKSDDAFKSSVSGLSQINDQFVAAIRHERTLGIDTRDLNVPVNLDQKRWGDNTISAREGSIVFLSKDGALVRRRHISAGLSIFIQGIETNRQTIFAYGSLGGLPAYGQIQ